MAKEKEDFNEIKNKVEAVLFSYADWIKPKTIREALTLDNDSTVLKALSDLRERYKEGHTFHVEESEDGRWRMSLKDEYEGIVSELVESVEMPANVMKVLSIIAYEMPVTKTRLSEIVGRSVKPEVNYLYRNKFLSYEKRGLGKYYRVTKKFYDYFKIDESSDFREEANKSIKTFLEEPIPLEEIKALKDEDKKAQEEFEAKAKENLEASKKGQISSSDSAVGSRTSDSEGEGPTAEELVDEANGNSESDSDIEIIRESDTSVEEVEEEIGEAEIKAEAVKEAEETQEEALEDVEKKKE